MLHGKIDYVRAFPNPKIMKYFPRKEIFIPLLLFSCFLSFKGFSQPLTCTNLKNGVFIFFSKTDGSISTYTRNGATQKEFNAGTRQTVMWEVEWVDDCSYYLKYNSGFEDEPKQKLDLLKKHKMLFHITSVTDDYYTFETFLDNTSKPINLKDTLWIKQHRDARNKTVSNPKIDSLLALRKMAFDAALKNSATLYVFRPGKFVMSAVSYMVYLDGEPICEMSNKSAYIVRLLKEGPAKLSGKNGKQESSLSIDVKYGKKYFLRCELPWGPYSTPRLTLVQQNEAETYFDRIR
jgi:hypothetical protein